MEHTLVLFCGVAYRSDCLPVKMHTHISHSLFSTHHCYIVMLGVYLPQVGGGGGGGGIRRGINVVD